MDPKFSERLKRQFADNLRRVQGLIIASRRLSASDARNEEASGDILRAAVVLLHATMEDLLRELEGLTLQRAAPGNLEIFNLAYPSTTPGARAPERLSLPALGRAYPGATIADVINLAITHALDHKNYNNRDELSAALKRLALDPKPLMDLYADQLEAMMRRRHLIAHRADRMSTLPTSLLSMRLHPIRPAEVVSWMNTVENFGDQIVAQYPWSAPC